MIGVEVHDILIRGEVLLDVGEELTNRAVNIARTVQKLLLIDLRVRQTNAGDPVLYFIEAVGERQGCLHRQIELISLCIVGVHIGDMEEEKEICLFECLDVAERAIRSDKSVCIPRAGVDLIVAAENIAVDAVRHEHGRGAVIAKILHAFRERDEVWREPVIVRSVEDLCVVRVAARLDSGECGVGVLRGGEMLIEDDALLEKRGDVGHILCETGSHDRP